MDRFAPPSRTADNHGILNPRIRRALALLQEAHDAAWAVQRDVWQFALDIRQLWAAGVTDTDLRWLLCAGYVQHGLERTRGGARHRSFRHLGSLYLPEGSCFVLTATGREAVTRGATEGVANGTGPGGADSGVACLQVPVPRWDGTLRQLCWDGQLVKRFRLPAPNQEAILAALEEEGWPAHIDDPLPRSAEVDARARLHDAIKGLNRHQIHRLVCFRGDGTGQGIVWGPTIRA